MKNSKNIPLEKNEKALSWGGAILLFILVWWIVDGINYDQKEEYSYCVEDCVYEHSSCISSVGGVSDKYLNIWIDEDETNSCVDDLEYCVESCKFDYLE